MLGDTQFHSQTPVKHIQLSNTETSQLLLSGKDLNKGQTKVKLCFLIVIKNIKRYTPVFMDSIIGTILMDSYSEAIKYYFTHA